MYVLPFVHDSQINTSEHNERLGIQMVVGGKGLSVITNLDLSESLTCSQHNDLLPKHVLTLLGIDAG